MASMLALTFLLLSQAPAAPAPAASAPAGIDVAALIEPIRARRDLPGMVAAIVDREGVVAIGACGVRERGREERMTSADRMHLGSCTKSMTATLCAKLVETGRLKWDTTLGASFADLGDALHPGWKSATLEQLLAHRGGAPKDIPPDLWVPFFNSRETPRAQREKLARGILSVAPAHAPGTRYEYSNAGIAIAGLMAERAGGKDAPADFEDLLRAELFVPLGMASAGFGPPGLDAPIGSARTEPRGHRADGKRVGLGSGSDNPPAITPAGRVHASLGDWGAYAALHLRGPRDGGLGLAPATFARMHTPPDDGLDPYALGWMVADRDWGGRVLTHSGSNTMWYCTAWLAPEKGFGVLVATNQGGDAAAKACDDASSALIRAWTERAESAK